MRRRWISSIIVGFFLCLPPLLWADGHVVGLDCPVTWTASTSSDLKEYRLYVTRTKGVYTNPVATVVIPAPTTQSTCRAMNLTADGQYYAVVTAVGLKGGESSYSNESAFVRDTAPPVRPNAPTNLSVGP